MRLLTQPGLARTVLVSTNPLAGIRFSGALLAVALAVGGPVLAGCSAGTPAMMAGGASSAGSSSAGGVDQSAVDSAAADGRDPASGATAPAALGAPGEDAVPGTGGTSGGPARPAPTASTTPRDHGRTSAAAGRSTAKARATAGTKRVGAPAPSSPAVAGLSPTTGALSLGPATESAVEAEVVRLVNVQRSAAGCTPVAVHSTLVTVARAHSAEMSTVIDGVKHNGLDGRTPFQRLRDAGYSYSFAAENIAAGQITAAAVMAAWMGSPGHSLNILNCQLTQIGVGVFVRAGSQYGTYWTQDFGTPL